jgi:hypothetical protein
MFLKKYLTGKTKPLPNPSPKREGLLKITSQFLPPSSATREGGKGDEVKKNRKRRKI